MKWLAETHGTRFELVRHFLARMFDSELCAVRGEWLRSALSLFALLLPGGMLLFDAGAPARYRRLSALPSPEPFRAAVMADELALLTLLLAVTGLIAVLQWQSAFPSRRDYLALAALPVRSRDIFVARFVSVLLFAIALVAAITLLPNFTAPVQFAGRWQKNLSFLANLIAQAVASGLGCLFVLLAIIAIQGVLLNVLPPRLFARVSVYVQGALTGPLLLAALCSGFIKDWRPETIARLPAFGGWAPPVWFAGLRERILGDRDPFLIAMSNRALLAVAAAAALTVFTYLMSYRRYRKLLLEAPDQIPSPRFRRWSLLRMFGRQPQQEAILEFLARSIARSRTHRLLLLAYAGAGLGLLLNSSLLAGAALKWSAGWRAGLQFAFLYWPLGLSVVMLPGFRHAFAIPVELKANWIFQLTESQGRAEWMAAVERFIVLYAIVPIYLLMLPVGAAVLGWPLALRTASLQLLFSLSVREVLFYSWQQLPLTCSYRPGKRPLPGVAALYFVVLGAVVPLGARIIAAISQMMETFLIYLPIFAATWIWLRKLRRDGWGEAKLLYEDLDEVVPDLGIREVTYRPWKIGVYGPEP